MFSILCQFSSGSLIDLRPTQHKIGHFGDVLSSQSLGLVLKKINQTQQEQTLYPQ